MWVKSEIFLVLEYKILPPKQISEDKFSKFTINDQTSKCIFSLIPVFIFKIWVIVSMFKLVKLNSPLTYLPQSPDEKIWKTKNPIPIKLVLKTHNLQQKERLKFENIGEKIE